MVKRRKREKSDAEVACQWVIHESTATVKIRFERDICGKRRKEGSKEGGAVGGRPLINFVDGRQWWLEYFERER